MQYLRRTAAIAAISLGGVVIGAAASLGLSSGSLGAAAVPAPRCTTAALSVLQTLSASNVASVTVGGIPSSCGGATLQVTVNNGTANASGSAAVPAGGGSVTVTLGSTPAVSTYEQTDLVLVGP
jgi:hypothetical protein